MTMLSRLISICTAPRKSPDELRTLQFRKLQRVLHHALDNVPFYRRRFQAAGFHPDDFRAMEDLERIPLTTKRDLQSAGQAEVLATGVDPSACIEFRTSGSTGTPLAIYVTPWERHLRSLIEMRTLRRIGFVPQDLLVSVGPHRKRPLRLNDRIGIYRTCMPGLMDPKDLLPLLELWQPTILWFYPGTLRALRHQAGRSLREYIRPRLLISSSEVLDELLRDQVRDDFGLDAFNFYGCLETGRIAAECSAREGLHVNADHVLLETRNGDRPAPCGEPGTVLVSTLNMRTMPFIRYELGDRVTRLAGQCSCGSPFPLIAPPHGRAEDLLRLPSGRLVPPVLCRVVLRRYTDVLQFRIIQERVDHLRILLVTRTPWPDETLGALRRQLLDRLAEPLTIDLQLTDSIPEEKRKFRSFVTHLPADMLR